MKTLKYRGSEYEVLDIFAFGGEYTVNLNIIAALKDGELTEVVEVSATYYKENDYVNVKYRKYHFTPRMLEHISKFAKAQ